MSAKNSCELGRRDDAQKVGPFWWWNSAGSCCVTLPHSFHWNWPVLCYWHRGLVQRSSSYKMKKLIKKTKKKTSTMIFLTPKQSAGEIEDSLELQWFSIVSISVMLVWLVLWSNARLVWPPTGCRVPVTLRSVPFVQFSIAWEGSVRFSPSSFMQSFKNTSSNDGSL